MVRLTITVCAALLAVLAFDETALLGQAQDDGVLSINLEPEAAEDRGTLPRSYRIYGEPHILRIRFSLSSQSDAPIVVDQAAMQKLFRIRLQAGSEIPVVGQWAPEIYLSGELFWIPLPNSFTPLLIEPQTGVGWTITLERADGMAFARGEYVLEYEIPGLQSTIRKADDTPWIGRAPSVWPVRLAVAIAPPSTGRERAAMHKVVANAAMLRREVEEAAAAYSRALAADPTDVSARFGLAGASVMLKRYGEAVPLLEPLTPRGPSESLVSVLLAQAYLGLDDEQNARRVLRMSGMSDERIASEVSRLREVNRRRR